MWNPRFLQFFQAQRLDFGIGQESDQRVEIFVATGTSLSATDLAFHYCAKAVAFKHGFSVVVYEFRKFLPAKAVRLPRLLGVGTGVRFCGVEVSTSASFDQLL